MRWTIARRAFALATCVGIVFECASIARGQTSSWSSQSGWRTGNAGATAPTPHPSLAGSSSSWTAGRGSIPLGTQAGGIWRDGSAMGGTMTKAPASIVAKSSGLAGLNTSLGNAGGRGPTGSHASRSSIGAHVIRGGGAGSGTHAGAHSLSGTRSGGGRRVSLQGGSKPTPLGNDLSSPLQRDSESISLAPSLPSEGTGLQSPLAGSSH
jgi:hypothetical protein